MQLHNLLPPLHVYHVMTIISYLFFIDTTGDFVDMQTIQVGTGTEKSTVEDWLQRYLFWKEKELPHLFGKLCGKIIFWLWLIYLHYAFMKNRSIWEFNLRYISINLLSFIMNVVLWLAVLLTIYSVVDKIESELPFC